jgi:outer membrane protein OmpA-like peptidoglycan-associated protein
MGGLIMRSSVCGARARFLTFVSAVVLVTTSSFAVAQNVQNFRPATGDWNYFSVEGTAVAERGQFVPSLYLTYARNPLVERDAMGAPVESVVENLTMFEFLVAASLHDRVEIGLAVPFGYGTGYGNEEIDRGAGLGDIRMMPKFVVRGAADDNGFGVAIRAPLLFPTGDTEAANTARHFSVNPELLMELRTGYFRMAVNGGYRWQPTDDSNPAPLTVGGGVTYGAGVGINLGTPLVELIGEVFGIVYDEIGDNLSGPRPLEALAGVRIQDEQGLALTLSAGGGLVSDYGAPEFRVAAGLTWRPKTIVGQVVVAAGGGAMSTKDTDGDGVRDVADACPELPEDADGFEDADGCPDTDNDQDGIADVDDKCPKHAEDLDGRRDEDGCPDLDDDKDGIADDRDQCPMVPENRNGYLDSDGCPDQNAVMVLGDMIRPLEKIYFDTNRVAISGESYGVLDQVVALLQSNPQIARVRIEGHTDAWGTDNYNDRLGQSRADAVREYLIRSGIDPNRLESEGFGESKVLGDGVHPVDAGRSRRVEFKILKNGVHPSLLMTEPGDRSG